MSDATPDSQRVQTGRPSGWRDGLVAGALIGAVARSTATAWNAYYLFHWAGPWFSGGQGSDTASLMLILPVVSAALGAIAGGAGGATCRPGRGAWLGAMVSVGFYLCLCVAPTECSLQMNAAQARGSWDWEQGERVQILFGIIPSAAAGALAGGLGARFGSRRGKERAGGDDQKMTRVRS